MYSVFGMINTAVVDVSLKINSHLSLKQQLSLLRIP